MSSVSCSEQSYQELYEELEENIRKYLQRLIPDATVDLVLDQPISQLNCPTSRDRFILGFSDYLKFKGYKPVVYVPNLFAFIRFLNSGIDVSPIEKANDKTSPDALVWQSESSFVNYALEKKIEMDLIPTKKLSQMAVHFRHEISILPKIHMVIHDPNPLPQIAE